MFKKLLITAILFSGLHAHATVEDIACNVTSVAKTSFENVNDFTFKDYPYLVIRHDLEAGWSISVGGMLYDQDSTGVHYILGLQGKAEWTSASPQDENWRLELDMSTGKAQFYWVEDETNKWAMVARFQCPSK